MSDPHTILTYASPSRKSSILPAVLLTFWIIIDALGGIVFTLCGFDGFITITGRDRMATVPFIVLGPMLLTWAVLTSRIAARLYRRNPNALRHAAKMTLIAELLAYPIALLLYLFFALRDHAFSSPASENFRNWSIGLAVVMLFPVATTLTRLYLASTARKLSSSAPLPVANA